VSRFVPGRTNRVRALRADRDTAPAAERIVGNETASNERANSVAAAASEAAFAAGRADRKRATLALQASSKLKEASNLNFLKPVPRAEAVAAAEQRALREQRAKEAAAVAKERGQRQPTGGQCKSLSMGVQQCAEHGGAAMLSMGVQQLSRWLQAG
jgi:hypothetical protein